MIWIVILLTSICIIGVLVTGGHYIAEPDRGIVHRIMTMKEERANTNGNT